MVVLLLFALIQGDQPSAERVPLQPTPPITNQAPPQQWQTGIYGPDFFP